MPTLSSLAADCSDRRPKYNPLQRGTALVGILTKTLAKLRIEVEKLTFCKGNLVRIL